MGKPIALKRVRQQFPAVAVQATPGLIRVWNNGRTKPTKSPSQPEQGLRLPNSE